MKSFVEGTADSACNIIPLVDFLVRVASAKMKAEETCYFSNYKCLEDKLFAFGMQCKKEYPCHFFIVDLNDANYQKHTLFNDAELPEIERLSQ